MTDAHPLSEREGLQHHPSPHPALQLDTQNVSLGCFFFLPVSPQPGDCHLIAEATSGQNGLFTHCSLFQTGTMERGSGP